MHYSFQYGCVDVEEGIQVFFLDVQIRTMAKVDAQTHVQTSPKEKNVEANNELYRPNAPKPNLEEEKTSGHSRNNMQRWRRLNAYLSRSF